MQSRRCSWILLLCIVHTSFELGGGHEIESLVVPILADPRENATLSCRYDMKGEHLYSAKWFKDDKEIFRYMPRQIPPNMQFNVKGVKLVDQPQCSQTSCDLILSSLSSSSQGKYRCEVSTEAPTFRIQQKTSYMTIAALPRKDPKLEGLAPRYSPGDEIRVTCTSDMSLPPPQLTFYVNEKENVLDVEGPMEVSRDLLGLSSRSLVLKLQVTKNLFNGSPLSIRCASTLPSSVPGGPHLRQTQQTTQLIAPPASLEKLAWPGNGAPLEKLNVKLISFTLFLILVRTFIYDVLF